MVGWAQINLWDNPKFYFIMYHWIDCINFSRVLKMRFFCIISMIVISFSLITCGCVNTVNENINPENRAINHYNNGVDLSRSVRYEEAIKEYDLALENNPKMKEAWYGKGLCYNQLERNPEARNCYQKVVDIDPKYAKGWFNKAVSEDRLHYYEDALISIQNYLNLVPNDSDAIVIRDRLIKYLS